MRRTRPIPAIMIMSIPVSMMRIPQGTADAMGGFHDPLMMRTGQGASSRGLYPISIQTAAYYAQSRHSSRRASPPRIQYIRARSGPLLHATLALLTTAKTIKGAMDSST